MGVIFYDGGSFIPTSELGEARMKTKEVLIDGVRYVPEEEEQERQGGKKLQVGDFVKVVNTDRLFSGKYGKVIAYNPSYVWPLFFVEFPEPIPFAHSGYGKTRDGHGWWFTAHELEVVN